ncbi:MAG: type II secretion system F family protein [Pseudomonadales bacterium]|nr:type II secretion system F family protein [Pseudomonadales bacterium]
MATFVYKGRTKAGELVEGSLEGANVEAIAKQLQAQFILPVEIKEEVQQLSQDIDLSKLLPPPQIKMDDMVMFCRQMKALTKAGIPIIQAINGLAEHSKSERLKECLLDVVIRLQMGNSLAAALGQYPKIFSKLFVSIIHVGESTGKLDDAFEKLIHHLELERDTKNRISQAVRYPMMVMGAMFVAMGIVNMFVIPQFAGVFDKLGAELPTPTKILMATSEFTVNYWWLILLVVIGAIVSFIRYIKTEKGEYWWDKKKIRLPIIGKIFEKSALSRFTRSFAMMSESGVPILQCLNIVGGTIGNTYISAAIADIRRGVERGDSLARTCAASGMFTPLILQMISVGEETGSLDALLHDVSDFYEEEIDYDLKKMADAIEPIILVFLGILVLTLALGIFLPMWELGGAMKK